uniref:Methyltransferase-like protein 5 n=1 Tax=Acrobeloides nanus TaxID=290746 RepID=A0A914ENB7_9BILA
MKKKQLISALDQLDTFKDSKLYLEQYATGSELGSEILLTINEDVGFEDTFVGDLGCGCGVLMIGASLLGCSATIGLDIDMDALKICQQNIESMSLESVCDIVNMDIIQSRSTSRMDKKFDLIVMNPPFGTKNNSGIDVKFIQRGLSMLEDGGVLYSLHKSSTRDFLMRKVKQWNGVEAECIAELRWNLEKTYRHQKKSVVDIEVDLLRYKKD